MRFAALLALAALAALSAPARAQTFANWDTTAPLVKLTAAGAGTTDSADQVNTYGKGLVVGINISAKTGTIAVTVKVQGKDYVSGQYYDVASSASLTAAGFTTLTVYPGIAATANVAVSAVLPASWRVEVVSGTGSSPAVTMTVGASVIE